VLGAGAADGAAPGGTPNAAAVPQPGNAVAPAALVASSSGPSSGLVSMQTSGAVTVNGSVTAVHDVATGAAAAPDFAASNASAAADISRRLSNLRRATAAAVEASSALAAGSARRDAQVSEDELVSMNAKRDEVGKTVASENLHLKQLISHLRDLHRDVAILVHAQEPAETLPVGTLMP
jgi:hypothetical protein